MFGNTRRCHKCSCHFASMAKTLLFTAISHLCATCISLNTSTAGSGARSRIPKRMSRMTWGTWAKMNALSLGSWIS